MKSEHNIFNYGLDALQGDPVTCLEYHALRVRNVLEGERGLMFAVLVEALDTYVKTHKPTGHRQRADFNEVNRWIHSCDTSSPFSFENVCYCVGINPDAIRRSLRSSLSGERKTIFRLRRVISNIGIDDTTTDCS
jgi:hypothetical protein